MSPSLNTLQPEQVAHGAEIVLQALGPVGAGYVTVAEIFEMDWDVDEMVEALPVLGSRRTGYREGRLKVAGSVKAYWINGALHSMWAGATTPNAGGSSSGVYYSNMPFFRYNIRATVTTGFGYTMNFINVVFEKDTSKWTADKFTEETITFVAEDVLQA